MYDADTLREWDRRHVWHPFTQMQDYVAQDNLVIDRGDGFYLVDVDGNRYIDGVSSLWVLVHGHGRRELLDAIRGQAERLCHSTLLGLANVPSIVLARKLLDVAPPGLTRVFYSDNGSTSVEIALKMAYQYWQQQGETKRRRFIKLANAYHGDTLGAVSVGGIDLFHHVYRPLLFKTYKAPSPYCYRCPLKLTRDRCNMACIEEFRKVVEEHGPETCAVIVEPLVQGAAGMITQPEGWLSAIWKIAKEHGLLFIADEVATGFGRTGRMFACEHEGVRPDFLCVAKGITGGYLPLAATLTTEEVFGGFLGRFEDFRTFFHGHTYTGNPVACSAAVANLELFEKEAVLDGARRNATLLSRELERFLRLPRVGEVRQRGLMTGVELVKSKVTKRAFPAREKVGQRVVLEARKRGVIIRPLGDVIVLMPPVAIDGPTLKTLVDVTYESIAAVTGNA